MRVNYASVIELEHPVDLISGWHRTQDNSRVCAALDCPNNIWKFQATQICIQQLRRNVDLAVHLCLQLYGTESFMLNFAYESFH